MLATVHYEIGTYEGEVHVNASPDDDDDFIIAKAKRVAAHRFGPMPLGMYRERWKVTNRDD